MTITWVRRTLIGSFAAVGLLVVMVPIAKFATTSPGVLEACVNPGNGDMRLVDSATSCHNNESRVSWNITGPTGPPGPQGPAGDQGPPGTSAGGPPFVWVCTPAHLPAASGSPRDDVYVFNGSANTATIAVNILDANGNNLAGHTIPGSATTYPGESGAATVTLAPGHTRDVNWVMPNTSATPATDTDVAFTVRVTSDQPIVVGANFQFNGSIPSQCSLLPK